MHWSKIMKLICTLLLMFASTLSFGCPNGLGWKDFSSISISSKNSSSLSLTLFTDASYVKIEDGSRTKEMYQLKDGPVLFRGVTPLRANQSFTFPYAGYTHRRCAYCSFASILKSLAQSASQKHSFRTYFLLTN